MKKLKNTIVTMYLATRYSLLFCLRNNKSATLARIIFSIATTTVVYLSVQVTGLIMDSVQNSKGLFVEKTDMFSKFVSSSMMTSITLMLLVLVFGMIIGELDRFYRGNWMQSLRYANQREVNNHRATFDVARFRSKEHDDLSQRIKELPTSWQTRIWFSDSMFALFATIISFLMFGCSLLWYQPIYVVVLVTTAIPMTLAEFNLVSRWWKLFQELVPEHKRRYVLERPYNETNSFVQALMFNQMPPLREQVKSSMDNLLSKYESIRKITVRKAMFTRTVAVFGLCIVILHTMWLISTKGGDIGTLTIVIAAARTFQNNLSSIVSTIADQWNSAQGVILIEKEYFGLKPMIETPYPVIPRYDLNSTIEFKNVSFKYPDTENEVLKNLNLKIIPGSKVAIVGKSGNGKSTLQSLLMRHYDPTEGDIYIGGVNFKNIEPKILNNTISALTQEYAILSRKVGEEIASSRMGGTIDTQRIIEASTFANFDVVIESDHDKYDTQIGTEFGGREFSGGEKQRLALARVYYRGTPILILDEPDSKLDPESAEHVIDQIFGLKDVTVVIITHHVSRAERFDNIVVMGQGEISEQGTHDELMKINGTYASMYHKDKERLGSLSESEI